MEMEELKQLILDVISKLYEYLLSNHSVDKIKEIKVVNRPKSATNLGFASKTIKIYGYNDKELIEIYIDNILCNNYDLIIKDDFYKVCPVVPITSSLSDFNRVYKGVTPMLNKMLERFKGE